MRKSFLNTLDNEKIHKKILLVHSIVLLMSLVFYFVKGIFAHVTLHALLVDFISVAWVIIIFVLLCSVGLRANVSCFINDRFSESRKLKTNIVRAFLFFVYMFIFFTVVLLFNAVFHSNYKAWLPSFATAFAVVSFMSVYMHEKKRFNSKDRKGDRKGVRMN